MNSFNFSICCPKTIKVLLLFPKYFEKVISSFGRQLNSECNFSNVYLTISIESPAKS